MPQIKRPDNRKVSPAAEVQESFKGDRVLSLLLPKENLQIARVFDILQEKKLKDYGINEWSIAQTSLNEVSSESYRIYVDFIRVEFEIFLSSSHQNNRCTFLARALIFKTKR